MWTTVHWDQATRPGLSRHESLDTQSTARAPLLHQAGVWPMAGTLDTPGKHLAGRLRPEDQDPMTRRRCQGHTGRAVLCPVCRGGTSHVGPGNVAGDTGPPVPAQRHNQSSLGTGTGTGDPEGAAGGQNVRQPRKEAADTLQDHRESWPWQAGMRSGR